MPGLPHLSTDQVAAFVELSRVGQIRAAADSLGITEQGVRNRLVALESQLGVELYRNANFTRFMNWTASVSVSIRSVIRAVSFERFA